MDGLPRVWLRITVRPTADGAVAELESSERPNTARTRSTASRVDSGVGWPFAVELDAGRLEEMLVELEAVLHDEPVSGVTGPIGTASRDGGTQPATIPVFVRFPVEFDEPSFALVEFVEQFVDVDWRNRITVLREPWRSAPEPPRLSLPMQVTITAQTVEVVRDELESTTTWFRDDLGLVDVTSKQPGARLTRTAGVDLQISTDLVTDSSPKPVGTLTILVTEFGPSPTPTGPMRSVLIVRSVEEAGWFLEQLTHDMPLHDAFAEAFGPLPDPDIVLWSSPAALHDLRLTDIVTDFAIERHLTETGVGMPRDPDVMVSTTELRPDGRLRPREYLMPVEDVFEMTDPGTYMGSMSNIRFDRESNGLIPLWEGLQNARSVRAALEAQPTGEAAQYESVRDDAAPDKRVVDITLRRHASIHTAGQEPFVADGTALQAGGRYGLRVRIGQPSQWSLVGGPVVPIAALLPDQDHGHDLDIVCFPGDFGIDGAALGTVHLPPMGPSTTAVEFQLTAPAEVGPASARVGVYFRNNLVQSFLFEATIAEREHVADDPDVGPVATQDHHSTRDWGNLDALGGRRLSLTVNSDGFSHRVYALDDNVPAVWDLNATVQADLAEPVRAALQEAIKPDPTTSLADVAAAGRKLYLAMHRNLRANSRSKKILEGLRNEFDQPIQIVRADAHQALPWALIYDWKLPKEPAPVCMGTRPDGEACGHVNGNDVVCVNGFWGIRHLLEELIATAEEPPLDVRVPGSKLGVDLATSLLDDSYISGFVTEASEVASVLPIKSTASLLARLWAGEERAPVCAVVGHYDEGAHTIDTGTADGGLHWDDVTGYSVDDDRGDLKDPHPLVLLFACDSGSMTPNDTSSHAKSLISVGVAGLLATECIIYTSHVKVFGAALIRSIASLVDTPQATVRYPLATAVRQARLEAAAKGVLAGLAFMSFGPATLRFVSTPT